MYSSVYKSDVDESLAAASVGMVRGENGDIIPGRSKKAQVNNLK